MTKTGSAPSPRTKPAAERRNDLLDAAEALVLSKGINGFTVDDVTVRASVSKGTFYVYFQSKEQILGALRQRYTDTFLKAQAKSLAKLAPGDYVGRVETWMANGIRGFGGADLHDVLFRHDHYDADAGQAQDGEPGSGPVDQLTELLQAGCDQDAFKLSDPLSTSILLYAAVHGAADNVVHSNDPGHTERVIEAARRLCRSVLRDG